MMIVLALVISESFTIAVMGISDARWESLVRQSISLWEPVDSANAEQQDQNLAVAAMGFAIVHLLCSYGLCKETAQEPPQETQPGDKSVQLV